MRMSCRTLILFQCVSHVFQLCSYLLFTRNDLQGMSCKKVKIIGVNRSRYNLTCMIALICMCLLLSACQIAPEAPAQRSGHATPTSSGEAGPTPSQSPQQALTPTIEPTPIGTPVPARIPSSSINPNRPVLA